MAVRTGKAVLERLKKNVPNLYIDGEKIVDVTTHPYTRGMADSLGKLYDLQAHPLYKDTLTYQDQATGEYYGTSFLVPKTLEDLKKKGDMYKIWATEVLGFMGRTPDYMNANLMAAGEAAAYFNQCERPAGKDYAENMRKYVQYVRDNDLILTHALTNPQVNRAISAGDFNDPFIALGIVTETEEGIIVSGARMIATLPIADELLIFPSTVLKENEEKSRYAMAFAVSTNAEGLSFQCRQPMTGNGNTHDFPLGARFDEQDGFVIFDKVLIPWERVFLLYDIKLANQAYAKTGAVLQMAHQVVCGKIAKMESMLGVAQSIVDAIGSGGFQHVQQKIAEFIVTLEILKALRIAAEVQATVNEYGVLTPLRAPLDAARNYFPATYSKFNDLIQMLGTSGMIMLPSEKDMQGPMGANIRKFLQGATCTAEYRVKLFRLAWDMTISGFGGRSSLYEKFFFGDPVRMASALYDVYDKKPYTERIKKWLNEETPFFENNNN
jgi:4-hydroxyphenylacetate 3-monooxygenase